MSGYTQLTREERYQIYILKKDNCSQVEIADLLGRDKSTISRESAVDAEGRRPIARRLSGVIDHYDWRAGAREPFPKERGRFKTRFSRDVVLCPCFTYNLSRQTGFLETIMNWQLQEAKNKFSQVVREAQEHGPQVITVHGKEAVVVLSSEEYARLSQAHRGTLLEFMRSSPWAKTDLDIERSKDTGRDIHL